LDFRFRGVAPEEGANYDGLRGTVTVSRDGSQVMMMYPAKRHYWVARTDTTEAAIQMTRGSNVFVALGDDLGAGKWSVRFQIRPLVNFVWLGAAIMALGGALSATDRRYRHARQPAAETTAAAPAVAGAAEPAP
jgi:cytochrome c-type biogenesis protein CcmF